MFARIQITHHVPDDTSRLGTLLDTIAGHPGNRGVYAMQPVGTAGGVLVTLWDSAADAAAASDRTREKLGPGPVELASDHTYEITDQWAGPAADQQPEVAVLVTFDGPLSEARLAAGERAHRERIRPAVADVTGHVGGLAMFDPTRRAIAVLALATSTASLEEGSRRINSAALLPGEDPALLTGPDRYVVCRMAGLRTTAPTPTVG